MQLDLTRYRQPEAHVSKVFGLAEMNAAEVNKGDELCVVVAPVELEFDLHKDKARFRLAGTVRTVLELTCSRCIEAYRLPVDVRFDLRYVPASEMTATQDDREVSADDLDTSVYRDDVIDLRELMREQFYLTLPMKPLCTDDCKGLCPQCGVNLNTGTCGCAPVWEDPRLAALRALAPPERDS
jgi:uncharacterized protein